MLRPGGGGGGAAWPPKNSVPLVAGSAELCGCARPAIRVAVCLPGRNAAAVRLD
jgi:hypothetical protein